MQKLTIVAGIVLYNPQEERLKENLDAIRGQVDGVVLVDNGSDCKDVLDELEGEGCMVFRNGENRGIAYALNQILSYCYRQSIPWVITLDQDSVVSDNIISVYKNYMADDVGIICPKIIDRNFKRAEDVYDYEVAEVSWCITSASLTNVKAWYDVGGFDSAMFIDWVDMDFCIALRNHGYRILQTMRTWILHELGENSRIKHINGREIYLLNRSPQRYYYVVRNLIYLGRKWAGVSLRNKVQEALRTMLFVIYYESHKWKNFRAMTAGFVDGFRMKVCFNSIK